MLPVGIHHRTYTRCTETLGKPTHVTSAGPGAYIAEGNIGWVIGTDVAGNRVSNIRVTVRDDIIQTALPF